MRAAVIDDTLEDAQRLLEYLNQFKEKTHNEMQIDVYHASFDFLEEYHSQYDVIFLDIEMPGSDGIEVAHEIREKDQAVGIIFVTNMAQYAIKGYEVNAIDFIVKPVGYYVFEEKMEKAIRFFKTRSEKDILLTDKDGIHRISESDILYIEKEKDYLIFHTEQGVLKERGSIKLLKDKLQKTAFSECTKGCLVNLNKIKLVGKDELILEDSKTRLPLSRRMKKQFTQNYILYIGGY